MKPKVENYKDIFKLFGKNGIEYWPVPVPIGFQVVAFDGHEFKPSKDQIIEMYDIAESLVRKFYEKSTMKWSRPEKLQEMSMDGMFHIQLRDSKTNSLAAFASFVMTEESDVHTEVMIPVLYIYEIQVRSEYQKQGLGSWLLKIIELRIREDKSQGKGQFCLCKKIMLTCHLANKNAVAFYRAKGFVEDPSCPSFWNNVKEARRIGYTILCYEISE